MKSLLYAIVTWTLSILTQVDAFSLRRERISLHGGSGDVTVEYRREGGQQYDVDWSVIDPTTNRPVSVKNNAEYIIENHRWLMFLTHMGSTTLNLHVSPEQDHRLLVTFTSKDYSFRYYHPLLINAAPKMGNINEEHNLSKIAMETVKIPPSSVSVAIGDDVSLTCSVTGGRNHGIRWYADGHLIYSDQSQDEGYVEEIPGAEVDIKETTSRGNNAITTTMIMKDIKPNDPSHVTCQFGPKDFTTDSVTMSTKLVF